MCTTNTLKPFTAPSPVRTLQFTLFNKPSKKEIKPPNYLPSPKSFAIFTAATVTRHIKDVHHRNLRTPSPSLHVSHPQSNVQFSSVCGRSFSIPYFCHLAKKKKHKACCYLFEGPAFFSVTVNESMTPEWKFVIIFESFTLIPPGRPTSTVSAEPWTDTGLVCAFQMAPLEHA